MSKIVTWVTHARQFVQEILVENVSPKAGLNRLRTVVHFFILVWRGFANNRCPVRAAALSYTTLLALVPLLAVGLSISKNLLHESSAKIVPMLMDKMVVTVAPQLALVPDEDDADGVLQARQEAVQKIQEFIDNINAGALGTVGTVFLVFVGIRLLMTIEQAFNDIWGIQRGRSIWRKVVYYWTTITLGPLLLIFAMYWTGRTEFLGVMDKLKGAPGIDKVLQQLLPLVVLWIAFAMMYALMPNTAVRPQAAIAGGVFAGTLWHLNSLLSTLYVSRVLTYSKIYGALGIIPVLLVGLYFSWLIVLLGAQVSYAAQNVRSYLQQRAGERIDQRGRELLACRAVFVACDHFIRGVKPPSIEEIAERIGAPAQWLNQLAHRLVEGGLLARVSEDHPGLIPARPPETLLITDVLQVVRTNPNPINNPRHAKTNGAVDGLLDDLQSAERGASANLSFSDLVQKSTGKS